MCPVCIATAALIAGSLTTSGGLAAIVIRKPGGKNAADKRSISTPSKEDHHGQQHP